MSRIRFPLAIGMMWFLSVALLTALAGDGFAQRGVGVKGSQAAIRRDTGSRTWREPITGMEFVKVPGGSFEMGCHANAGKCDSNERPTRTVRLDDFWMGKYEVTQGQWKRIMGSNPSRFKKGNNYPVEKVSWNDVQEFIRRLNRKSSAKFRLPSEAQWEYSCRAGGRGIRYAWGNQDVGSGGAKANVADRNTNFSWSKKGIDDGHANTAPVGSYQANSLGLHDMSGNLWEWTADEYTKDYRNAGTNNPIYQGSGGLRVVRGGGWGSESRYLRCSSRDRSAPSVRRDFLGFRLRRSK